MASNRFGSYFTFTTFGESHGKGVGVVIDGCPSGVKIDLQFIQKELDLRKPGKTFTSPRAEADQCVILSGVYENYSTGAPIALWIENQNQNSKAYEELNHLLRPGHANFTYSNKYQHFDPNGGGRSSARETAARVAAGAIAKLFLDQYNIKVFAYLHQLGSIQTTEKISHLSDELFEKRIQSPFFTIDSTVSFLMKNEIERLQNEGDSTGGIVHLITSELPIGLGDPVYEKLEAQLAFAMLSIPGTKGIEFGLGFFGSTLKGSETNDLFENTNLGIKTSSNHSGGTLGGISTGSSLDLKVAFKPTSSIKKPQSTLSFDGIPSTISTGPLGRHDPCIAIRGVMVVEAMAALVLADRLLANRLSTSESIRLK